VHVKASRLNALLHACTTEEKCSPRGEVTLLTAGVGVGRSGRAAPATLTFDIRVFRIARSMLGQSPSASNTGCLKKAFTTLKAYINLFRGHAQCFELRHSTGHQGGYEAAEMVKAVCYKPEGREIETG
jgi:hypothetical protein